MKDVKPFLETITHIEDLREDIQEEPDNSWLDNSPKKSGNYLCIEKVIDRENH